MYAFKMSLLFNQARQYYRFNDAAHQYNHFVNVLHHYQTVVEPYLRNNLDHPRYKLLKLHPQYFKDVLISILAHDLFAIFRKNHETMAYWFVKSAHENFGCVGDVELLALAAKEHRASGSGQFTSILSEIVATADKPFQADDIDEMVVRCYQYGVSKLGLSHNDAVEAVPEHLRTKFGREGYIKYPPLWLEIYESRLEELYVTLDQLTTNDVRMIISDANDHIEECSQPLDLSSDATIQSLSDWLIMAMTFMMNCGVSIEDNTAEINGYLRSREITGPTYAKISQVVFSKITSRR